jgi:ParB family chromosome partitioning protein
MGKLDELRRGAGANVAESMSKGLVRPGATHGATPPPPAGPDRWAGLERLSGAQTIPLDRIVRDEAQPREVFDEAELAELAASIGARGVLQPIRVRWDEGQGMYVVIAGERRLRAARMAGRPDLPCVVQDGPLSEAELLLDQLAENIIRLDLQPIEQARAFKRLMDANAWSARRLAEELHVDHDKISRAIKVLRLPEDVQEQVASHHLAPSTAAEIARLPDAETQRTLARQAVAEGLSRDQVAEEVRKATEQTQDEPTPESGKGKGKGKGKAKGRGAKAGTREVTTEVIRTSVGPRITLDYKKGLTPELTAAALREAAARAEAAMQSRGEAAA